MAWKPGDPFNHLEALIREINSKSNLIGPQSLLHILHLVNVEETGTLEYLLLNREGEFFAYRDFPNKHHHWDVKGRPHYAVLDHQGFYFRREIEKNIYLVVESLEEKVIILERREKSIVLQRGGPEKKYTFLDENSLIYPGKVDVEQERVTLEIVS